MSIRKRGLLGRDLDLDLQLDPRATVYPWGAMAHLSHQSQGTPSQQLLDPTSLVPTHHHHLDLDLDPVA